MLTRVWFRPLIAYSLITNLTKYDKESSARGNQRCDGADAADGVRCETAWVVIITSPPATTVAPRHRPPPCIMFVTMTHCVFEHHQQVVQCGWSYKSWSRSLGRPGQNAEVSENSTWQSRRPRMLKSSLSRYD